MKKFLLFSLFCFLFSLSGAYAYVPSADFVSYADKLGRQMDQLFSRMSSEEKTSIITNLNTRLVDLQNNLIGRDDTKVLNRLYLIQYLARNIPWLESFEKEDIIYDELTSTIWTRAKNGFDILYQPFNTPRFESHDSAKKYRALVNGGYFNKIDGSIYHAGLLALDGQRYTPPVFDNPQVTHFLCQDSHGIRIIPNIDYHESLIDSCDILFQAGPVIYSKRGDLIEEDTRPASYIGKAHKRTVLVLFEKSGIQDIWFLTINEEETLAEVRNIVLREVRFIGTYDTVQILNLDGGSSVAHINYTHPELNIGRTKILPIVVGIK